MLEIRNLDFGGGLDVVLCSGLSPVVTLLKAIIFAGIRFFVLMTSFARVSSSSRCFPRLEDLVTPFGISLLLLCFTRGACVVDGIKVLTCLCGSE